MLRCYSLPYKRCDIIDVASAAALLSNVRGRSWGVFVAVDLFVPSECDASARRPAGLHMRQSPSFRRPASPARPSAVVGAISAHLELGYADHPERLFQRPLNRLSIL
jgi:hypothetical protein